MRVRHPDLDIDLQSHRTPNWHARGGHIINADRILSFAASEVRQLRRVAVLLHVA